MGISLVHVLRWGIEGVPSGKTNIAMENDNLQINQ